MLFSHGFHGSLILLRLPHLAGYLPTLLKYSSSRFVLVSCTSFPLKPFYCRPMGLSLVAWPLATLISTRYTHLTVSSQDLHMRERTLVFVSLSYHLWYVFPCVCRVFSGDSCVSAVAHMRGKSVEVRVQPRGWVLTRPAWLQRTLEKPELLHVQPVFLQRDTFHLEGWSGCCLYIHYIAITWWSVVASPRLLSIVSLPIKSTLMKEAA